VADERFTESRTLVIDAPIDVCYEVMCDFEQYPRWQKAISTAKIVKRDKKGKPQHVEYTINILFRKIRYVLDYTYDDKNKVLEWGYVEGDMKDVRGRAAFKSKGPQQTEVEYSLAVAPGIPVPQKLVNYLTNKALGAGLNEFRKQVEKLAKGRK